MAQNKGPQLPPGFKAAIEAFANVPDIRSLTIPTIDLSDFAKAHANALAVFPEMQRHVVEHSKDIENLQKQLANIRFPPDEVIQQMAETAKRMESVFANLPRPSAEQIRAVELFAKTDHRKKALDRLGVLPHASTPFALLDGERNDDVLRAVLERHYQDKWSDISRDILGRSERFGVDAEAKAVLAEALESHQAGHYRSVCRLLLPEIERVARVELLGNEVGTIHVDKVVGGPAMELPINETNPSGYYALGLYERLTDHLYVKIGAANRGNFERDLVPNRHAAIHGLIVYNSFWHSLNTIFMTDFAFQVISAIKHLGVADE